MNKNDDEFADEDDISLASLKTAMRETYSWKKMDYQLDRLHFILPIKIIDMFVKFQTCISLLEPPLMGEILKRSTRAVGPIGKKKKSMRGLYDYRPKI
ncbi:hypothetical protein QE152_g26139 [Popillia japonica]|uniref:Uncharacterized protein n=1 Tax=Popillia japonica TaxID=7064 RepID=A0AAW1K0E9_POPJA